MSDQLKPGDRILWAGKNGTVRSGTALREEPRPGTWFVEIEPDPAIWAEGFRTWFRSEDLIKVSGSPR